MKKLAIGFFLVCLMAFFGVSGLKSEPLRANLDKKSAAIEVAKTRVKIAEIDLEGAAKEHGLVRRRMDMMNRLQQSRAVSQEDHLEVSRAHMKAVTDMQRARARVEEAKALLKYAETVGEVDLTLTAR